MPSLPAGYRPRARRAERRRISRVTARQQTRAMHTFLGTTPRIEPAGGKNTAGTRASSR